MATQNKTLKRYQIFKIIIKNKLIDVLIAIKKVLSHIPLDTVIYVIALHIVARYAKRKISVMDISLIVAQEMICFVSNL